MNIKEKIKEYEKIAEELYNYFSPRVASYRNIDEREIIIDTGLITLPRNGEKISIIYTHYCSPYNFDNETLSLTEDEWESIEINEKD